MDNNPEDQQHSYLEQRVEYLEQSLHWHVFALEMLSTMGEIHGDTSESRDPQHIFAETRQYLSRLFQFETMGFMLINEENADFELIGCEPEIKYDQLLNAVDKLIENNQFSWALNQGHAHLVESDELGGQVLLHVISTKTRIRGMFIGQVEKKQQVTEHPLTLLTIILSQTAYALESAALYDVISRQNRDLEEIVQQRTQQLDYEHTHDDLTDLPNRLMFTDRLSQSVSRCIRNGSYIAVVILDIDRFKFVNDTLGHESGDTVLKSVAQRLISYLRVYDTVSRVGIDYGNITISRFGGDEFCILLTDVKTINDAVTVIQRLTSIMNTSFTVGAQELFLTSSIGISLCPEDGRDAELLINHADLALYHAKQHGGNTYQFYSEEMNEQSFSHLMLGNQLRSAISHDELVLHYQPKVELLSGRIIGVEALVRWEREDGELVPPDKFIPVAEQTGLIVPLGEWVIDKACHDIQQLLEEDLDLRVAVNLSAAQFKNKILVRDIHKSLENYQIDPRHLEVELTESVIMHDIQNVVEVLHQLRSMNIHVAVDDFGTGYSSLSYLKRFPLDTLKIDKSFITDVTEDSDDAAIVSSIVSLSHNMNMSVIAEGVETESQLNHLRGIGCDQIQGYYYSKPLPLHELLVFLKQHQSSL